MPTPKKPAPSYSAGLRLRRQARGRPTITAGSAIQIGNWLLVDEDGDLVIVHRPTGARTVLMSGEVS